MATAFPVLNPRFSGCDATGNSKAQGGTEYLVLMSVVLGIALICVALLVWPVGTTKDAKKQQTDIHFKINEIGVQVEDDNYQSITQGLVAYYKFEEGSGTSATDSRGGYTCTLANGPTWTSGKSGQAVNFDGINDYATLSDAGPLDMTTGDVSVGAWFNPTNATGNDAAIVGKKQVPNGATVGYAIGLSSAKKAYFNAADGTNSATTIASTALNESQWHHVVGVWNSAAKTSYVYLNGVLENQTTNNNVGSLTTPYRFRFATRGGLDPYFNGTIDEVMIYNRVLSASEIRLLYENPGYPQ